MIVDPKTGKNVYHIVWKDGHEDFLIPNGEELHVVYEKPLVIEADSSTSQTVLPAVKVEVNKQLLNLDPPALVENDRTLVPMRAIFEALDATITWDDTTQTVTGTRGATGVKLTVNSTTAWVNDKDVPPKLVKDRTFVPARFVAQALGATVAWDEDTQTVVITGGQ